MPEDPQLESDAVREKAPADRWWEGDASAHLEELVVEPLAPLTGSAKQLGSTAHIELVGPHLRVAGDLLIGHHRRLSDFVNHHDGLMELRDATVLRRNGEPTRVTAPSIWISPAEVTLIGEVVNQDRQPSPPELRIAKGARGLVVVTPGHTLTGEVYLSPDAELSAFIESTYPAFIPMTDVRARSLADRRVISRYPFALLNRRHIVAATGFQPGMLISV